MLLIGGLLAAGCSSDSSSPTTVPGGTSSSALSPESFTDNFTAMAGLRGLAAAGRGRVVVLLPDTSSSARYAEFDAPSLTRAFTTAGLGAAEFSVQNALGNDATQLAQAQAAIAAGATVLVVDPIDSDVGTAIESSAESHHVAVIDYDRLTEGGSRQYYVGFDNGQVGSLLGRGLVACVSAWGLAKPQVAVLTGSPTDSNAVEVATGSSATLRPYFTSGKWVDAANLAATSDPATAESEFQEASTNHRGINAVLAPSDETAAPIITYLKTLGTPAKKVPITGQGATLIGLQNIISGYQCGTIYEPIDAEAQAAAALALYLRAHRVPPSALVNGKVSDRATHSAVPSVLLDPVWVTPANVATTVIRDNFVTAAELCAGPYAAACRVSNIG